MRISYKGRSKDYDYRVAEVTFNDENKKEQTIVERAIFFLERTKGYRIDMPVPGYAICKAQKWRYIRVLRRRCKRLA